MPITKPKESDLDSLYSEDNASSDKPKSVDEQERKEMETTAIVPMKLLSPDGEPVREGDEITVKVNRLHGDDEAEISYCSNDKKPSDDGEMSADNELEEMGKEKY